MVRVRGALLLPFLVSGSFIVSSILRLPQYLQIPKDIEWIPLKAETDASAIEDGASVSHQGVLEEVTASRLSLDRLVRQGGLNDVVVPAMNESNVEKNEADDATRRAYPNPIKEACSSSYEPNIE